MSQKFDFENLVELCRRTHEETQRSAARATAHSLVARNWLFGRYIVEYEQHGADRAEYGSQTLRRLSVALTTTIGRGFGERNLRQIRQFYLRYSSLLQQPETPQTDGSEIWQTPSAKFTTPAPESLSLRAMTTELAHQISLGWSHYVTLLTIDNPEERRFYELEAAGNGWSVRELERQIDSSLYERLALSRDKEEVRRLASEGQVIEKASDLIKNPLVLEFLGLEESPSIQRANWKRRLSTGFSTSCWSWARDFCSRRGRSGLLSTTVISAWTSFSTTGYCTAMF